ncbi:MAG: arginine--tRNA ligase [Planctomycetota bacterium]|nr:MAG: arginine--tRNA ligase [Planctomycetota bacterium]
MEGFLDAIAAGVAALFPELEAADVRPLLQTPSQPERGDVSLPCFPLAAKLGKKGKQGALEVAEAVAAASLDGVEAEAAGPFVNFRIAPDRLAEAVLREVWQRPRYGASDEGRGKTVVIDFSSPNIAKPFHLGHLRSTVIGWSLGQIFRALGYRVVGVNHLGDWGTQFGFMIAAWKRWQDEAKQRVAQGESEIEVFAKLYARINSLAEEDPAVREEAQRWFKKLEDADPEAQELWTYFVERSKREFARIYELLGVSHESDAGEAFYNDKMQATVERLRASGLLVEGETKKETAERKLREARERLASAREKLAAAEGELAREDLSAKQRKKLDKRIEKLRAEVPRLAAQVEKLAAWVPAEDDGERPWGVRLDDGRFAILLKADGGTTYTTRDLTAAYYRAETYSPEQILYVVGSAQRDHFEPWFEIVRKLGEPWAEGLRHVGFGKYLGMSTRKGTAVFLDEVLEKARQKAREAAAQATKKVELSPEETERVARAIGTGAVKFFDLKNERIKDIDLGRPGGEGIDWERLLDLKGDTGPYLQFAYARLAGILRRWEGPVSPEAADFSLLSELESRALLRALAEFPARVRQAARDYEPSVIARYVIDLAQKTHAFVHHHRVIDAEPTEEQKAAGVRPETLRATRVLLVRCAQKVIGEALDLLGIEALEQM